MVEDFRVWILQKVEDTTAEEMVEDNHFVSRLMNDVLWGRSKKFNRTKSNGKSQGLNLLQEEYEKRPE